MAGTLEQRRANWRNRAQQLYEAGADRSMILDLEQLMLTHCRSSEDFALAHTTLDHVEQDVSRMVRLSTQAGPAKVLRGAEALFHLLRAQGA